MNFLKHYLLALAVFAAVDMVWLLIIAKNLYRNKIGFLMADRINVPAAVIFLSLVHRCHRLFRSGACPGQGFNCLRAAVGRAFRPGGLCDL